jgi:SAM-dependent methyltransferase
VILPNFEDGESTLQHMDKEEWTEQKVDSCDLCGSSEFAGRDPRSFVVICERCKHVFVEKRPPLETIARHYTRPHYEKWLEEESGRNKMWRKRWNRVRGYKPPGKWFDVGCGLGTFLDCARKEGWTVSGSEVSHDAAKYCSEKYGIEVFEGPLESARFPDSSFDAVSFWHVLEHLPSPRSCLEEVRRILRPGGIVVIAVPNDSNWKVPLKKLLRRPLYLPLWESTEIHLSHFSPDTLSFLLEKVGFRIVELKPDDYYPNPSFWTDLRYGAGCILRKLAGIILTTTILAVATKD